MNRSALINDAAAALVLDRLAAGSSVRVIARGGSMRPFVRDGDTLTLSPDVAPVRLGDVVLLRRGAFGALHRVAAVAPGGWLCVKGDAVARADGWFDRDALAARVVGVERLGHPIRLPRRRALAWSWSSGAARCVVHAMRLSRLATIGQPSSSA